MGIKEKCAARREAILNAALAEFSSKGYACARVEDIARRAGVAKGTIYLYFKDKEGLFNGLIDAVLASVHAHTRAVLAENDLGLREKLLRIAAPLAEQNGTSRVAEVIRLVCAEGLHNPELVASYYRSMLAPIIELHRENLRRPLEPAPHPALIAFPQLLMAPLIHGLLRQGMFGDDAGLDLAAMYRAYLDMILPEPPA